VGKLNWLLDNDRWKKVGSGYYDINDFLKTLNFSDFKIAVEQRKEIALKLESISASQRATAKMLGVDNATIHHDLRKRVENSTVGHNTPIENEDVIIGDVENSTPEEMPAWIGESGQKEVEKKKKNEEKVETKKAEAEVNEGKRVRASEVDATIISEAAIIVTPGDIIALGEHLLYCGDTYDIDIEADALITDPPYGISYEPDWRKWDGTPSDFRKITGDTEAFNPTPFMKYKTMLFFGANNYSNNLPIGSWLVWDKRLDEIKDAMIGSPFELAWFISQHTTRKAIIKRILHGGVVNADSIDGNNEKRYHPTQKPVILFQSIIEDLTKENEIIYDPFAGSGTALLACELSNRKCRAVEIDPEYCAIIVSRWEKMTNKKAIWM